jgi:Glycosyl hydrolase family 26
MFVEFTTYFSPEQPSLCRQQFQERWALSVHKGVGLLVTFAVALMLGGAGLAAEEESQPRLPSPDGGGAALGVFAGQDGGDGGTWETSTLTAVHAFERQVGDEPKMVHMFYSWYTDLGCAAFPPGPTTAIREGYAPLLTWEYSRNRAIDRAYNYAAINAGTHDTCIRGFARGAAAGGTVYLRPFHEMNSDWYSWGVAANGNTPASHVAAWRHVVDIFRSEGANNVKFVWCPNIRNFKDAGPYASYYPGDAYVDYLCLDGYNWAEANGGTFRSFDALYRDSYAEITALSPSRPVMVGEFASHESTIGSKQQWITDARKAIKDGGYPRIKVLNWFNHNRDGATWQVDSSHDALDAYRALAADPYFQAPMPAGSTP